MNVIETAFIIMNLGVLSAAGLYKVAANVAIMPITCTSIGITFVLFVVIISYHLAAKILQTKCGQEVIACVIKMYYCLQEKRIELGNQENCITDSDSSDDNIATYPEVKLTEPLLVTD